ncbi:hypothetical protein CUN63_20210 [Pseudomonas sp. ACM7]|nr:hypothetical protein CUN63_20210 [Pseudomonas sp. ACM7]
MRYSGVNAFTVGAGLLAKAACQSTSMLNVKPHSRASPLPQGIRGGQEGLGCRSQLRPALAS